MARVRFSERLVVLALGAVLIATTGRPAAAIEVASHRAVYRVELDSARSGSQVSGVSGEMTFRSTNTCNGWASEQRYRLNFLYAQGNESELITTYATWESHDGRRFEFSMRNLTNGTVDEELRGHADLAESGGGVATYRMPEQEELRLPPGTMFPTAHTIATLSRAEAGERVFHALLFDGTKRQGLSELNAIIGEQIEAPDPATVRSPLLARPSWPVRLAFFALPEETATPDYEMSIRLYDNSVVDEMVIDYGSFAVRARLTEIETIPDGC